MHFFWETKTDHLLWTSKSRLAWYRHLLLCGHRWKDIPHPAQSPRACSFLLQRRSPSEKHEPLNKQMESSQKGAGANTNSQQWALCPGQPTSSWNWPIKTFHLDLHNPAKFESKCGSKICQGFILRKPPVMQWLGATPIYVPQIIPESIHSECPHECPQGRFMTLKGSGDR